MFHSFLLTFTRGYLDISIFMRKMQCLTFFWFKYLKIPFVFPHVWGKAVLSFHKMVRIFLSHQRCDSWFFCFPSRSGAPFQWIRWWSREVLTSRGENSVTNMALICSQYERGFLMGFLYGYYIYMGFLSIMGFSLPTIWYVDMWLVLKVLRKKHCEEHHEKTMEIAG